MPFVQDGLEWLPAFLKTLRHIDFTNPFALSNADGHYWIQLLLDLLCQIILCFMHSRCCLKHALRKLIGRERCTPRTWLVFSPTVCDASLAFSFVFSLAEATGEGSCMRPPGWVYAHLASVSQTRSSSPPSQLQLPNPFRPSCSTGHAECDDGLQDTV